MQVDAEPDVAWIDASRRGDRAAFAQIIGRYQRAVYAVAYAGVRDRALADDITQETFVTAWRRLSDLRDDSRLPAWLCGIARNLAREARKRSWRETLGEPVEPIDMATPFEALSEAQSERLVATALGLVPDVYREPLVLFYYEERSVEDVARSLGISPTTTNKRLSRGRQYLADRVATIERGLARRGPSPGLAASVLATIGLAASASHVDASPAPVKGSTMSKLAIAAIVTASLGGAGLLIATVTRGGDAQANSSTPVRATPTTATSGPAKHAHAGGHSPAECMQDALARMMQRSASGTAASGSSADVASAPGPNDCATVGRHLAELEGDTTHGPNDRPDEATCAQCAAHYTTQCENEGWSAERRTCALAAGDLINAHLCAGSTTNVGTAALDVPPELTCSALSKHMATTAHAAGIYSEVTDLPQQIEAACEMGGWGIEMRRCFLAANSIATLQACVIPATPENKLP
ncbi:MAG TPA: sigma-70 family RNA polymerase sigma factor [Kofleriaceae bacterium]